MQRLSSLVMIVVGGFVILGPIIAHPCTSQMDKDRLMQFHSQNPNAAEVPRALAPSEYEGYEWACFGVGTLLTFSGVRGAGGSIGCGRRAEIGKPAGWEHPLS